MTIDVGDKLPGATLTRIGPEGPEQVDLGERLKGRRVALFAVPGAFTPTCHSAHLPSFIRSMDSLREKGVDEVICISVNDPHVMKVWGEVTGAHEAGITLLADADSTFTRAVGMEFSAPAAGLINRSQRYAMLVEDGVVRVLNREVKRGTCELSGGEALAEAI